MPGMLERLFTPWRLLGVIAVLAVIATLVERPSSAVASDYRLTTYAHDPTGARGMHETLERLDLRVRRRTEGFRGVLDTGAVYVVLDPPIDLTRGEVAVLLDAVSRGAGLIVAATGRSRLTDSLDIRSVFDDLRFAPRLALIDTLWAVPDEVQGRPLAPWPRSFLTFQSPPGPDTVTLVAARGVARGGRRVPVVLGMRHGRGRVAVIADPGFLRNDVLRHTRGPVLFVRLLEWVRPAPAAPLIFDEYHQGFGTHANLVAAIAHYLAGTSSGRALAQLAAAGLVLLIAHGARPLPPRAAPRAERRSALEHVDALARAYQRAGAAGTVARRLIRGLRRRHALGVTGGDDARYLRALRGRRPSLAADVAVLEDALAGGPPAGRPEAVADAITRVDLALASIR